MEPIISALIGIAVIGFVCYVLITLVSPPEPFPKIILGTAVILTLLWLLNSSGVVHIR